MSKGRPLSTYPPTYPQLCTFCASTAGFIITVIILGVMNAQHVLSDILVKDKKAMLSAIYWL